MISVSGDYIRIIFKICQTVAGISITSHFQDFFKSNFWRVFTLGPVVDRGHGRGGGFEKPLLPEEAGVVARPLEENQ